MRGANEHLQAIRDQTMVAAFLIRTNSQFDALFWMCQTCSKPFLIVPYQTLADLIRQAGMKALECPFQRHMAVCRG
jgi:hypothetical protein